MTVPVVRWLTWWPAPYWIARFNRLAERSEIALRVSFLASSQPYHAWATDPEAYRFDYELLEPGPAPIGYRKGPPRLRGSLGSIRKLVKGGRSSLLVTQYGDPRFVAAIAAARLRNVPYLLFVPNTRDEPRSSGFVSERVKRRIMTGSACLLVPGPLQEEYVRDYVGPRHRVIQVGNPVDTDALRPRAAALLPRRDELRASFGWNDDIVFGYVGRLAPEKAIDTLVRAAAETRASGLPIRLALVGSGPAEEGLRRLADSLQVPTEFLGYMGASSLSTVYASMDVFVLPSLSEPWGLVVNEAMEFGLPIIASSRVGARGLVQPSNGFTVQAGDPSALANAMAALARDGGLRARMGKRSQELIASETIDSWTQVVVRAILQHATIDLDGDPSTRPRGPVARDDTAPGSEPTGQCASSF